MQKGRLWATVVKHQKKDDRLWELGKLQVIKTDEDEKDEKGKLKTKRLLV